MDPATDASALLMRAAWLANEAGKAGCVSTEMHRKPGGQITVGCRVEGDEVRYFEITVETNGTLSLSWMRGLHFVRVTGLAVPQPGQCLAPEGPGFTPSKGEPGQN